MPPTYYASGTNKFGEIRGAAKAGRDIGVAADQCLSRGLVSGYRCDEALLEVAKSHPKMRLFIDSGAFSEVSDNVKHHKQAGLKPEPGVLKTVKAITPEEWDRRLALMERMGKVYGSRLLIMAPDKIADQAETLRRLRWFRKSGWLDRIRRTGAEIAVVLQGGELDLLAFDQAAAKALGWSGYLVAFPMAKGSTPIGVIEAFMSRRMAPRVHLLGIGPTNTRAPQVRRRLFKRYPKVHWSWDSAELRKLSGRPKSGPKPYSAAQDYERAELAGELLQGERAFAVKGGVSLDYTDLISQPSLFLLRLWGWPQLQACTRELLRAKGDQLALGEQASPSRQRPALRADTTKQRANWLKKKAKWDACRAAFDAEARKTARDAGLVGPEVDLFIADPDGFAHSLYPDPRGRYDADNTRLVYDPLFQQALNKAFHRWTKLPNIQGGPSGLPELIAERAAYRALRESDPASPIHRQITLAGLPGAA